MIKILKYLKPYFKEVIFLIICVIGQVYTSLKLPNLMSSIVDVGIIKNDMAYIWKTGAIMVLVALVGGACIVLAGFLASRLSSAMARDLRGDVFRKVESFSLTEFNKFGTSSLITRTNNDITQIQNFTVFFFRMVITAPLMCIGGVFMAITTNSSLSWIILVSLACLLIVILLIGAKSIPIFKSMQKKVDNINRLTRENLTGLRVIKAFTTTKYELEKFEGANKDLMDTTTKGQKLMSSLMPLLGLVLNLTIVLVMYFGGRKIAPGGLEIGQLMAYVQYVMQIMMSIIMLSIVFMMYPRAAVSAQRTAEVIDTDVQIKCPKTPKNSNNQNAEIEFKKVSFAYPGAKENVLNDISFKAKVGEVTAFIGSTGSGKSTLINLIPRFYDVTQGQILVDGIDVKEYDPAVLREKIGYIPQKGMLFSGTISQNIRYGKPDATDEEVASAAEIAQATDFINAKPLKFDEPIAQGGTNVSGGQKQRLSIARAIVGRPEIYIFDDSFSALDYKTDANLREALFKETKNSTVLIVAQRVSTIMKADRIIVLNEGDVVGIGTHRELLESCQVYYEIASSQLSKEELENE